MSLAKQQRANDLLRSWAVDRDGDGKVTKPEFRDVMKRGGIRTSEAKLDALFEDIDANGSGRLSEQEMSSFVLEELVSWATATTSPRPIIRQYRPASGWLWKQWDGTVTKLTWKPSLLSAALAVAVTFGAHAVVDFPALGVPPPADPAIETLGLIYDGWNVQLGLTTFVLSFFTAQAYGHWRDCYFSGRNVQGRANDINLLLSMVAQRDEGGGYTPAAMALLEDCARYTRLANMFHWATSATGLKEADLREGQRPMESEEIFCPELLTPAGLAALVKRGELSQEEADALVAGVGSGGPSNCERRARRRSNADRSRHTTSDPVPRPRTAPTPHLTATTHAPLRPARARPQTASCCSTGSARGRWPGRRRGCSAAAPASRRASSTR